MEIVSGTVDKSFEIDNGRYTIATLDDKYMSSSSS